MTLKVDPRTVQVLRCPYCDMELGLDELAFGAHRECEMAEREGFEYDANLD